jgi:hypothetical protein
MLVAKEAERSQPIRDVKYNVITTSCDLLFERMKFFFVLESFGKEDGFLII